MSETTHEYPSAAARHKANACLPPCVYCIRENRSRHMVKFIPAEHYQAYREQVAREEAEQVRQRQRMKTLTPGGRIIVPTMVVPEDETTNVLKPVDHRS